MYLICIHDRKLRSKFLWSMKLTFSQVMREIMISENLLAGVKVAVTVRLHVGSAPVDPDSKVKVMPSDDLEVNSGCHDNTVVMGQLGRGEVQEWGMMLFQEPHVSAGQTLQNKVGSACVLHFSFLNLA